MNRKKEKSALRKKENVYVLDLFVQVPSGAAAPIKYTQSMKLWTEENEGSR